MSFAQRVQNMPDSGTLEMNRKAQKLIEQGKDIISFSLGEPDFTTPKHIIEAAKRALDNGFTHYTVSSGIKELREAIADKCEKENGIPATPETVLVTVAKHAIFGSVLSSLRAKTEVIISDPCWTSYHALIYLAKAKAVTVNVDIENQYRISPEEIMEKVTNRTKVILLNSPSNPTGSVNTKQDINGIADIAIDHDLIVISDEIYEKVIYSGKHHSIAAVDDMFNRTYTINGFSKAYAMTGWRIGWVTASKNLLRPLGKIQQHTITCATSFAQKAALAALQGPPEPLHDMVRTFKKRRDFIVKELNKIPGFYVNKPKGAFYAFPSYDYDIPSIDLATRLLEFGIAVTPGSAFGNHGEYHLRFSYATSMDNITEGLIRLRKALDELNLPSRN